MNFLFLMNNTGTCAWRVFPIKEELEKDGHNVVAINVELFTNEQMDAMIEFADVLTLQMVTAKYLVERAKEKGIFVTFDCDDYIDKVPPKHPYFKKTQDKSYQSLFRWTMKNVDLMTVSNERLYNVYSKFAKNIMITPNYLPDKFWEKPLNVSKSPKIRIGWAGGVSHQEDLDFISPIITEIVNSRDDIKFVYTGGGGWNNGMPNSMMRFNEDQFPDIPYSKKEYNAGSRIELWPDRLNSMQLDVALAPLDENEFSVCKTHIKYFEYAINHWPGVYQEFLYKDVVRHGETGFLATTSAEWSHYINILLNDPQLRKEMGERAYRDVKNNYTFDRNKGVWREAYRLTIEGSTKHRAK